MYGSLLLWAVFSLVSCYQQELWSTEHLNDYLVSDKYKRDRPAVQPAVIALYETRCRNRLYDIIGWKGSQQLFPNALFMLYASYDRSIASTRVVSVLYGM